MSDAQRLTAASALVHRAQARGPESSRDWGEVYTAAYVESLLEELQDALDPAKPAAGSSTGDFSVEQLRSLARDTDGLLNIGERAEWMLSVYEALLGAAHRLEAVQSLIEDTRQRNTHDQIDTEAIEEALDLPSTA